MIWTKKCYSRLLIDSHITDLKPEFMAKFDPKDYVRMVKISGIESSMIYACDHNGNCYYPTGVGHMHAGIKGRDVFGETVKRLKDENIIPIAYYTVIYHNDAAKRLPSGLITDITGKNHEGRYHFCCPNSSAALEFFQAQIKEILSYPVEGIFLDMTFWPMICYCQNCREKFRGTYGHELPEIIDWNSCEWVEFQRFREDSLAQFAARLTKFIRKNKPEITVTHQFSPVLHGWFLGQSSGIATASDYASGDFYGNKWQQRLGGKVFDAYSKQKPFEYMTSRCVSLNDHTSTKSDDELFLHALTTLANGGAYFFIDAINPDGTLEEKFYRRLNGIVERLSPFAAMIKKHVPENCAEVGLYFSMSSCIDESLNNQPVIKLSESSSNMGLRYNHVLEEVLGVAILLNHLHIQYKVITDATQDWSGLKAVIVNNAAYLSHEESERIRCFAADGGLLIATGKTSLYEKNGSTSGNFQLRDVLGVDYSGNNTDQMSYLNCSDGLICAMGSAPLVKARLHTKVQGKVTLPDFPINNPEKYASIHSNPPGITTTYDGLTENVFGKGQCIYLYSSLLALGNDSQQQFGRQLLSRLPRTITTSQNLPKSAEIMILKSTTGNALILTIVNYQDELPNIPLRDLKLSVRLPHGFSADRVFSVLYQKNIPFETCGNHINLEIPELEYGDFFEITSK